VTATVPLPPDLVSWIETTAGGRLVGGVRQPGGGRREAWFVDLEIGGAVEGLFLRYDRADPAQTADPWTLFREGEVYLALQDTAVPVPPVLAVHDRHQAILMRRLTGENWFARITDPAEQEAVAREFMTHLAALHRIDARRLPLPTFPISKSVPDLVRHELDELEGILEQRGGDVDPALTFTLDWLRRHVPAYDGPAVLVQGDTGPGNFMFADGRVVAVVDWELAHLGDPMDDIAWLTLRCAQDPFPDIPARVREYVELSGHPLDEARVRYYQVMAEAKLQVMGFSGQRAAGRNPYLADEGGGGDLGNAIIYRVLHRRLWFEALAAAAGLELTGIESAPPTPAGEYQHLAEAMLAQLRDVVVPRITDPLARQRSKGFARVIKYLSAVHADAPFYDEAEMDDLTALLGERPPSLAAGRSALAAAVVKRELGDTDYLTYLWHRVSRENELARPALGALADRHWPAIR
jgi:aminoglycoside phosphotransferase (APT) family kinase protein